MLIYDAHFDEVYDSYCDMVYNLALNYTQNQS